MTDRRVVVLAVALACAGAVALAMLLGAPARDDARRAAHDDIVAARRDAAGLRARDAADAWLRGMVERLSAVSADAAQAWLDATEARGGGGRRGGGDAPWERLKALLAGPKVPEGARVAVYEPLDVAADNPPLHLLGWVDAKAIVRSGLDGWAGRVPAAVLQAEADAEDPLDAGDLVWFSREADGVRLHAQALFAHTYETADETSTVTRGFDASLVVRAPDELALVARCDLVDGAVATSLPEHAIAGRRAAAPGDVVAEAGDPAARVWRHPVPSRRPRLVARAAPPAVPPPPATAPWYATGAALAAALAVAGLAAAALLRRATVAPDVSGEAAHELKTPLTVMRGTLEVALRRERTAGDYRDVLASTLEEVKGLQNVVHSLLLLTRGAETPPAREPVDVIELVRGEAERVHAVAKDREVTLASVRGPRLVVGDPSLLARAVGNLLDNAHLHSVAGGRIRVRVEVVGAEAIVSVDDDGPGIPPARREKVFERFWRGPEVGQRGIPGAGLGLPIARWIAELHGGTLTLDPAIEGRARFVLRLPLDRTAAAPS